MNQEWMNKLNINTAQIINDLLIIQYFAWLDALTK